MKTFGVAGEGYSTPANSVKALYGVQPRETQESL